MKKFNIVLGLCVFLASLMAIVVIADAEFSESCNDENIVYRANREHNAHVSVWNASGNYLNACFEGDSGHECTDFDGDGANDNVVFRVNRDKNAHVEEKDEHTDGYKDLCFGGVECSYKEECDISIGEECFGSMKKTKNSHVGTCDEFQTKICCSPGCRIGFDDVYWSVNGVNMVSSVNEKDVVLMVVDGTSGCGEINNVSLKIKMESSVADNVLSVKTDFDEDGKIRYAWQARRHCDKHALQCVVDPIFYFEASFGGHVIQSDEIVVRPEGSEESECGDGLINGIEICDIGSLNSNNDDVLVHNLRCSDQFGWNGTLTCDGCAKLDTSSCSGVSGSCGNNVLNPGESCDGSEYFGDFNTCNELKGILSGELKCENCEYDSIKCILPDGYGEKCTSCSKCDDLFSNDCSQNVCVNACPGIGSCYYDSGVGEDCKSCQLVTKCEDYTNDLDCDVDRCVLLLDKPCTWEDGKCKENDKCSWNCDDVYSGCVNGVKNKVSACSLVSGDCNAISDNPARNYPDEVVCLEFEEDFPVFGWFNLIISIFLLISYYFIKKRFK